MTEKKRPKLGRPPRDRKWFSGSFVYRPGSELHEQLVRLAQQDRRSLNEEVTWLLERAIAARALSEKKR